MKSNRYLELKHRDKFKW